MRVVSVAVSATAVAAGLSYLIYKRVHSRAEYKRDKSRKHNAGADVDAQHKNAHAAADAISMKDGLPGLSESAEPFSDGLSDMDGLSNENGSAHIVDSNVDAREKARTADVMAVLPESGESYIDGLSRRSPLRIVFAHALTRRVLGAVPLYAVIVFLWGGINAKGGKAPTTAAYFRGLIISFGFNATLWPTDKGVRSRSWLRVMTPLTFLRAVLITRAVDIEIANIPVYASRVGTMAHYAGAFITMLVPWTIFVLDVRGKNRWAYIRALRFLGAGSMLATVVVLRCTTLGPHSCQYPPRMRGSGFPFHIAVARPTFALMLNALFTPANRQALARLADRMGLTHVPIQLSQLRTVKWPRDVWAQVQTLMNPSQTQSETGSPPSDAITPAQSESSSVSRAASLPARAVYREGGAGSVRAASLPVREESQDGGSGSRSVGSHHTAKMS